MVSPENIVSAELEWYYCYSDADCGEKSNYMAMISGAYGGNGNDTDPYSQTIINFVSRKVSITKRLNKLTKRQNIILKYTFGPDPIHPIIEASFGKYSAIANLNYPARELIDLCYSTLTSSEIAQIKTNYNNLKLLPSLNNRKQLSNEERIKLSQIKSECIKEYNNCIMGYYNTKRNK